MASVSRVEIKPFTTMSFRDAVVGASGCDRLHPPDQVRYLESYLSKDLRAGTMLVERNYTDRHYIEEFAVYYSKLLNAPPSRTTRLHFFDEETSEEVLIDLLQRSCDGDHHGAETRLNDGYLGFVVVRPFPHAPVGRTALRYVAEQGVTSRNFAPARMRSTVHLAGFDLYVVGLPFQQQDQGVGACATTSLWSMLAGTFRHNGQRPPLPAQITAAAHALVHRNRRFPAIDGLTAEQMVAAIDHFGYTPGHFSAYGGDELFLLALLCYLRSGFPVLLHVADDDAGHTLCAVGFSPSNEQEADSTWTLTSQNGQQNLLRFKSVRRIYVHEDRLGPYARCSFLRSPTGRPLPSPSLAIVVTGEGTDWTEKFREPMTILHGLVALYPKLRLSARELIEAAVEWAIVAGDAGLAPLVELRFELGGAYLRRLATSSTLPASRCAAFLLAADLSRYVGVVSMAAEDGSPLFDVLLDATDIRRASDFAGVLAVVPFSDSLTDYFRQLQADRMLPPSILIA
jgi:hypothetical protein